MKPDFKWKTRAEKLEVVRYWWREQRGICWICKDRSNPMEPYAQGRVACHAPNCFYAAIVWNVSPYRCLRFENVSVTREDGTPGEIEIQELGETWSLALMDAKRAETVTLRVTTVKTCVPVS